MVPYISRGNNVQWAYEASEVYAVESSRQCEEDLDQGLNLVKDVNIVCVPRGLDPWNLVLGSSKAALDA